VLLSSEFEHAHLIRERQVERGAASVLAAAGLSALIVADLHEYEEAAVRCVALFYAIAGVCLMTVPLQLARVRPGRSCQAISANTQVGTAPEIGRVLTFNRTALPLFDTARWIRNHERALRMVWDLRAATGSAHSHVIVRGFQQTKN
jgi:hypothetical protein